MLNIEVRTIGTHDTLKDLATIVSFKGSNNIEKDRFVQRCVEIEAALHALEDAFPNELFTAVEHICKE